MNIIECLGGRLRKYGMIFYRESWGNPHSLTDNKIETGRVKFKDTKRRFCVYLLNVKKEEELFNLTFLICLNRSSFFLNSFYFTCDIYSWS